MLVAKSFSRDVSNDLIVRDLNDLNDDDRLDSEIFKFGWFDYEDMN